MHEILSPLRSGSRVLDLACGRGSFDGHAFGLVVTKVDSALASVSGPDLGVQADAAKLPFRAESFDAVVCNHGLEHFDELDSALSEMGRVVKRDGAVYVAVPDCTTLTDRLYRWLGRGGGHVNGFRCPHQLEDQVAAATGLAHAATRPLFTSLSFLNSANTQGRRQLKLALFLGGSETLLALLTFAFRVLDRWCGTRLAVYGWASYFGTFAETPETEPWSNVCVRCGSGHPSGWLREQGRVRRMLRFWEAYDCPACGARNLFTCDARYGLSARYPERR